MKKVQTVGDFIFLTLSHFLNYSFLPECPEEAYDPRSLYERLQEQREKKQQEFEEQFKFSKHQPLLLPTELSKVQQLRGTCRSDLSV